MGLGGYDLNYCPLQQMLQQTTTNTKQRPRKSAFLISFFELLFFKVFLEILSLAIWTIFLLSREVAGFFLSQEVE